MPSLLLEQDKDDKLLLSTPLTSMEQLKNWSSQTATDSANVASKKLQKRPTGTSGGSTSNAKLLLCHDMAGGYKEDNAIQGNNYETIYSIQYWQYANTFVYFSHNRVTIPPVNWINACHRNGIACLGTFIVEGDAMSELELLLHGPTGAPTGGKDDPMRLWSPYFADKLVAIAKHYGFDGWLMNIECTFMAYPTPVQYKTEQLMSFLDYFTKALHEAIPGSSLIWYDSLTKDGEIDYQNQLTELNLPFFKVTDGIFLNYWWKENYPNESLKLAESIGRSGKDVYFGTDVWGRGTFDGGRFDSYKAVDVSRKAGTSSALFAMAWTYEYFQKKNFDLMERLFWRGGLASEFPTLDDSSNNSDTGEPDAYHPGVGNQVRPSPGPNWFFTCFDRGYGNKFYLHGKELLNEPWSHLSHQSIPFSLSDYATVDGSDAYIGGSSLILHANAPTTHTETQSRLINNTSCTLFKVGVQVDSNLKLSFAYKPMPDADDYKYRLEIGLVTTFFTQQGKEQQGLFIVSDSDKENADDSSGLEVTNSISTITNNGYVLRTVDLACFGASVTIHEIRSAVTIISAKGVLSLATGDDDKPKKLDVVRLGMISIAPKDSDIVTDITPQFDWKDVQWKKLDTKSKSNNNDDDQVVQFFGTVDWAWQNNRKGNELRQQQLALKQQHHQNLPDWCQIEFALLYLAPEDDTSQRIFLGTSFSTLYRISGASIALVSTSQKQVVIVEYVDALGRIQSTHTIDLPSISYYSY